ncbi:MAG: flagellar motor switch protein FliG [Gemmatimonadota bacterium]
MTGRVYGYPGQGAPPVKAWTPPPAGKVEAVAPERPAAEAAGARRVELSAPPPSADRLPPGIGEESTHAAIWRSAPAAAAVVRTILRRHEQGEGPLAGLAGSELAAAFFVALGEEVGARVLGHLDWREAQAVAEGLLHLPELPHNAGVHALELVRQRIEGGDYLDLGGEPLARRLLGRVFGRLGDHYLGLAGRKPCSGFETMEEMEAEQVAPFISHEHPQTIALVLSHLSPGKAAGIIGQLPERMQADVAYRMSTMEQVTETALQNVDEAFGASLGEMLAGMRRLGGPQVVAEVLNRTGSSTEKAVLDQMDAQDPKVAEAVRNLMFTFADLVRLTDREIQVLLREVDEKDLTVALKAADDQLRNKILGNMSERVRTFITEQIEFLGPMRLTEVEQVQRRIVRQVRQLEEQGQVTIVRGDAVDHFV